MRPAITLFSLLCLTIHCANAQQDSSRAERIHRIELQDGLEVVGTIISQDSMQVEFLSVSKVLMTIPRSQVKSMKQLTGTVEDGVFRHSDPNYTRLFFAPTARSLKNGQGYFSAYEIFFPFLAVGVADVVTLAGGMSLVPAAESQIFYLAPKVTPFHMKDTDLSVGLLYINATSGGEDGVGIVYAVGTHGTPDAAITVGAGWGFAEGELSNKPILLLGGELRISRTLKLISENWIPSSTNWAVYSFGIRFFGENLAADLGFIRPSKFTSDGFPFIPWIGFAYNFGGR
jgi:hypothetical protein